MVCASPVFTMILYNSKIHISKPIPKKSFDLSHCSRYKVILSSFVCHSTIVKSTSSLLQ